MILTTLLRLECILAGAVSANQPEVHVDYVDWNPSNETTAPDTVRTALNSANDVIVLAAPILNPKREVIGMSVYNKDSASVTLTIKTDNGTTEFIIVKKVLATLETLHYSKTAGWFVTNA